jgi:hypothetical protein
VSIPRLQNGIAACFKLALLIAYCSAAAQQTPKEDFTPFSEKSIALTHAEVVDGTRAAARPNQTIVIRDGVWLTTAQNLRGDEGQGLY